MGCGRTGDLVIGGLVVFACLAADEPARAAPSAVEAPGAGALAVEDQRCLAEAVYYEAGFEPREGQQAVAQVVLNRLRSPGFPNTVCGVVYQRAAGSGTCQFTFTCDGALARRRAPAAWAQAELVARAALAGRADSAVGDALNYHAWYVAPAWRTRLQLVTRIGAHLFYRPATATRLAADSPLSSTPALATAHPPEWFAPWGLPLQPAS